mgnify:CR=1 FL=1
MRVIGSERFSDHRPPSGHPEQPARGRVMHAVGQRFAEAGGELHAPRPATRIELERVHAVEHVDRMAATAGEVVALDPDTYTSEDSYDLALSAVGATIEAATYARETQAPGVALVRPPGHHAEQDRAMGFCLFNSVAVAAADARAAGIERVVVIDYDVHHGNGTQWMFYEDATVMYVSLHQYPFYPGTGGVTDVGRDAGAGFTVNVPLAAGAGDADFDRAMRKVVVPVATAFDPGLVLLSAGFDAHRRDPLGGMEVSTEGFGLLTAHVQRLAAAACEGRLGVVTEGGYDLEALEACLDSTLAQLRDGVPADAPASGDTSRVDAVLPAVQAALSPYWPGVF